MKLEIGGNIEKKWSWWSNSSSSLLQNELYMCLRLSGIWETPNKEHQSFQFLYSWSNSKFWITLTDGIQGEKLHLASTLHSGRTSDPGVHFFPKIAQHRKMKIRIDRVKKWTVAKGKVRHHFQVFLFYVDTKSIFKCSWCQLCHLCFRNLRSMTLSFVHDKGFWYPRLWEESSESAILSLPKTWLKHWYLKELV